MERVGWALAVVVLAVAGCGSPEPAHGPTLIRLDDSVLVGVWEGQKWGHAETLTVTGPLYGFCGNAYMGSVDGVFYDNDGRAVGLTPLLIEAVFDTVSGVDRAADGRPIREQNHYRAYLISLDGRKYLGLAPIHVTRAGVEAPSLHRWYKVRVGEDRLEIQGSTLGVSWLDGPWSLEDAGGEVSGTPGRAIEPGYGSYATASLQRFAEFHARIADDERAWAEPIVWRRAGGGAGGSAVRGADRP